ncbi:hypothetical protein GCM10010285_42560 [Streptomyces pseudogriseolus]|uniref:Uncharacterized protein n=1 Tax=Streptomyces pseudogriseolus TaxID=36817 RepID=A0ABQ2T8X6_STREZ|nr:hypothetical protein GCM10010285_42560 [Streptomyces rubiginosus]
MLLGDVPPDGSRRPPGRVPQPRARRSRRRTGPGAGPLSTSPSPGSKCHPHRVERIVDPADVPPPEPVRERVTVLVRLIAEPGEGAAGEADGDDARR